MDKHLIGILKRRSVMLAALGVLCCLGALRPESASAQLNDLSVVSTEPIHDKFGYGALTFRDGNLWCGWNSSLFLSVDTGKSWRKITLPKGISGTGWISDIDFQDKLHGAVATTQGLFITSDAGMSWFVAKSGTQQITGVWTVTSLDSIGSYICGGSNPESMYRISGTNVWQLPQLSPFCLRSSSDRSKVYQVGGFSTDRGTTWTFSQFGSVADPNTSDSWTLAVDSCDSNALYFINENLAQRDNKICRIYRTLDGGKTWDVPFSHSLDFLCGSIVTSTRAIYCQTVSASDGLLRSTDMGSTWQSIGGPSNVYDTRFITVVNDSIIMGVDATGTVWRYNDPVPIAGVHNTQPHFLSDTVHVKLCDIASMNIRTFRDGCKPYPFDALTFSSPDSNVVHFQVDSVKDGDSIMTTTLSVTASHTGTYKVLIKYRQRQGSLLFDSSHLETVIVTADSPHYAVTPHTFDFGAQSLCIARLVRDTFSVSFRGCGGATIDSMFLRLDSGQFTDFTFTPISNVSVDTAFKRFVVSFKPTKAIREHGKIFVYLSNGQFSHVDTILLTGAGLLDSQIFIPSTNALDFGIVGTCQTGLDTTVTFYNKGCNPDTITSATLVGAGFTLLRDSLPIIVRPGDSTSFRLHFMPDSGGTFPGTVNLRVVSMGQTQNPSIALNGSGLQGMGILNVASTAMNAGSFSFCAGDTTVSTSISNTGCDTLRITNIHFAGDAALSYLSSVKDTILVPDSAKSFPLTFSFYFAPRTAGVHTATLTFHSANLHGNDKGHDTTITISGLGIADKIALSLPTISLALPQVIAGCTSAMDTIWLFDSTCRALTIDGTRVEGAAALPIVISSIIDYPLPTDSSIGIIVSLYPTSADTGAGTSIIRVFYHGEDSVQHDTTVTVSASAVPPAKVQFHLGQGTAGGALHAGVGGLVKISIYVRTPSPISAIISADITSLDLRVWFNTDLLTPLSLSVLGQSYDVDVPSGGRTPLQYQLDGAFLHLPLPTGFTMSGDSLVATLTCQAFVTDTMQTRIWLDPVSISAQANEASCLGVSSDTSTLVFTLDPVCPDNMLSGFVGTHAFQVESIVPNPASNTIEVRVSGGGRVPGTGFREPGGMGIAIYDVLGNQVHGEAAIASNIGGAFSLDVSNLPDGSYYLRINSGGFVVTRQFVIRR